MTADGPVPVDKSDLPSDPAGQLVATWTALLTEQIYLPMSRAELHCFLTEQAGLLAGAGGPPVAAATARKVGSALVHGDLVGADMLAASVAALGHELPALTGEAAVPALLAAVSAGYVEALWNRILDQQESVRLAEVMARRGIESALRSSEVKFRAVFENAGIGISLGDLTGRLIEANRTFAGMLGYTVPEFLRMKVADLVHPDELPMMRERYAQLIAGTLDHAQMEKAFRHKDGSTVWTNLTVSLIRDPDGRPLYTVGLAEDITGRRELQERLRHQAMHDPLTQLPNRALFQDRLAAALDRPAGTVGVCYLDLDGFKMVNDRLGHDIGDSLLVQVAGRLAEFVGNDGRHLVARMGGDEFVVLVADPAPGELAALAERILTGLRVPFQVAGHELAVGASIGLVRSDLSSDIARMSAAELLKAADVTLYWAKSDGRGRWAEFDPVRNSKDMTRYTLSANLLPGLHRDEFVVEYQPLVRLGDGGLHGVEALVRWRHPTLGRLSPDAFIDLAEETGSIVQLGLRVLEQACAQGAAWNAAHPGADLLVSVNLTVRQASEPGIVSDVVRILSDTGLRPDLLQLELTESALLGPVGRPAEALAELQAAGVRIAVDDFGTGYSNLAYLGRLPLDELKLAGTLIDGLRDELDDPIVVMLVELAHRLGLGVTAEAVETREQVDRLRTIGCDTAQGWYFARPSSPDAISELLDEGRLLG